MMECREIIYSGHAVRRMFERDLGPAEVRAVIESGEIIAQYPEDQPFPSFLLLGWSRGRPIQVVVASEELARKCYVITAYIPDPELWQADLRSRR
jgi:hypothetical protein